MVHVHGAAHATKELATMTSNDTNHEASTELVPPWVQVDILFVRDSGLANMLDAATVSAVLDALGMHDSAWWIEGNLASYIRAILCGLNTRTPVHAI
jgi:hypothetical protein